MSGFGICENPDILRIISFIKILINVVKFLVPMGLIIMVSLDIGKGVISGENDFGKILKASGNKILAAMIIFLIPTIVNFVLVFVDETTSYESCWANANSTTIDSYQVLWDEAKKKEEEKTEEEKKQEFITSSNDITFSYQYVTGDNHMPYALYTPSTAETNETTPLIVWLHEGGKTFKSNESFFKKRGMLKILDEWSLDGFNAYVICPHMTGDWYFGTWVTEKGADSVISLIDMFVKKYNVNTNKIILVGHSQGARGVMYIAGKKPKLFSAITVMSGFDPANDITQLKNIPAKGYSENGYSFMKKDFANMFGKENYTEFKGADHMDVPKMAFNLDSNKDNKSDLIEWMLMQGKGEEEKKKQEFITSSSDITFSYHYEPINKHMPYALYTPSTTKTNDTTPLIIWLHGGGEIGNGEENLKNSGLLKLLNNWKLDGFNAYVLCPYLSRGLWVDDEVKQKLYGLVDDFIKEYNVNTNKIILTGHSRGGTGVMNIAYQRPEFFSALVVLSGYGPGVDIKKLKSIPTRGYSEPINFMQNEFKNTFGSENYYPLSTWHGDVPNMAFNLDENHDNKSDLVEWMLTQEKR